VRRTPFATSTTTQLGKHVERRNKVCVIVENTLQARYLANRAKRGAPNLPNTFGDGIRGRKDLIGLLILGDSRENVGRRCANGSSWLSSKGQTHQQTGC
jgi:hypothetical protein